MTRDQATNEDELYELTQTSLLAIVASIFTQDSLSPHLPSTRSRSSRLERETCGNVSFHSYGRVASMIARELNPFWSFSMIGSSGPLQQRRRMSISSAGSERVHTAQSTSFKFVGSISSST